MDFTGWLSPLPADPPPWRGIEIEPLSQLTRQLRPHHSDWMVVDPEKARYQPPLSLRIEGVFPELLVNRAGVSLRGLRYREDISQRRLSELTGIPQRHLSEMENGKRTIGKETARKLADALHADYRVFL